MTHQHNVGKWIEAERTWQRHLISFVQWSLQPLVFILSKKHVISKDTEQLKGKPANATYVLYGNHQHELDAALIAANLPRQYRSHLRPFRFITANIHFFRHPFLRHFLQAAGGYPAQVNEHGKAYGIDHGRFVLDKKQTLVIFPEGKRTPVRVRARTGITHMIGKRKVTMIPVKITWGDDGKGDKAVLTYGAPFKFEDQTAQDLMDIVYDL